MEGRIFLPLLIGLCLLNGQGTFAASPSPPATSSAPTTVTTTPDAATTITSVATSTEESSTATPATSTIDVTTPTTMKPTPAATSPSPSTTTELVTTPSSATSVTAGQGATQPTATIAGPTELVTTPSSATSVTAGQGATQPTATTAGPMETDTTTANDTAAENPTATPTNTTSASPEMPSAGTSTSAVSSTVQPTTGNLISSVSSTEPLTTETSASTVRSTAPPTSTSDFCSLVPCEADAATCINIQRERICRCPYGYYYDSKICSQGKQFFVTVKLSKTYSPEVVEPGSAAYKELYQDVHDVFGNCFNNQSGYEQTIITKISYSSNTKRFWKSAPGSTVIEVINIFRSSSSIEEEDVFKAIEIAADGDPLPFNATRSNPCNSSYCDEATTHCEPLQNGTFVNCTCKDGFYTKTPELRTCKDCAPDCSKTNFKECVQINGGSGLVPSCQCLADYQFNKEKKTCVLCDFGYSGKDCKDNFLLILVIVGVVLGALLLGLLGAVIGLSVKSKRNSKTPDRERLIDHEENPVFGSGTSTNGSLFPKVRAKPTVNANVATMNPYTSDETFQRSVPTRDYDDDNDSWYEMSQKDNRYENQSKY